MTWRDHPLCAPHDWFPDTFWGPEQIDGAAFRELLPLCTIDHELDAIVRALAGMTSIVDVGGGTGVLSQRLAEHARVIVVEPDAGQRAHVPTNLDVREGRAERVPVDDRGVDAAMATWVLQYTSDPIAAIDELARIARERIVIVQAAPGNDLVEVYNREAAIAGRSPAHHGWLLAQAAERFEAAGFAVELERIAIPVRFTDELAAILARLHFSGHDRASEMVAATEPYLAARATTLNDDAVVLVARHRRR